MRCRINIHGVLLAVALLAIEPPTCVRAEGREAVAQVVINPAFVRWLPQVTYAGLSLRVAVPDSRVLTYEFTPGQPVGFEVVDEQGQRLPNGQYTYELIVTPQIDPGIKQALQQARAAGTDRALIERLQQQGGLPRQAQTQSGYFTVLNGMFVVPGVEE